MATYTLIKINKIVTADFGLEIPAGSVYRALARFDQLPELLVNVDITNYADEQAFTDGDANIWLKKADGSKFDNASFTVTEQQAENLTNAFVYQKIIEKSAADLGLVVGDFEIITVVK